ncbi:hypothetical protein D9611_008666 [Ephemerocybe angulata]|uniref:F-box domain-containing protein n=1 Tax=Ephemerocybe angulata TaxID=980116 RepID=A0A8H5AYI0_9AGAR|nr:hypothetical protein D9611_008666 [Tulosesus angulatus]
MPRHNGLYELLNSNNSPNSAQVASVQQAIDGLSKRIVKLQGQLKALEGQRRQHQAILSPIRRIPLEILGEIFALVLPDVLYDAARQMLMHLNLVCKSWRNACLLAHQLWTGLCFKQLGDGDCARVASWFNRSGTLPRTLRYVPDCNCASELLEDQEPCSLSNPELLRLLTQGPSLDHFALMVTTLGCFRNWIVSINSAKEFLSGPFPWDTLKSFHLAISDEDQEWGEPEDPSQSIFNHLPVVSSLSIALPADYALGIEDDGEVEFFIPVKLLNQMTTFAITYNWHGTKVFSLLEHFATLENLTIAFDARCYVLDEQDPKLLGLAKSRLVLPKVREFHFRDSGRIPILKYLSMPALSTLDIDLGQYPDDDNGEEFGTILPGFLKASNASVSLQALRIAGTEVLPLDILAILSNLLSLKKLTLDGVAFGDRLFNLDPLHPNHNLVPSLPALEHLQLLRLPKSYDHYVDFRYFEIAKRRVPCLLTMSYEYQRSLPSFHRYERDRLKELGVSLNVILHDDNIL